jgi:hypothetical protein
MKLPAAMSWETIGFILSLVLFIAFGPSVGWRAIGVLQLVFAIRLIRQGEIPVGWEGSERSFFVIHGRLAFLLGLVCVGLAVMLLLFPEETVMRGWR